MDAPENRPGTPLCSGLSHNASIWSGVGTERPPAPRAPPRRRPPGADAPGGRVGWAVSGDPHRPPSRRAARGGRGRGAARAPGRPRPRAGGRERPRWAGRARAGRPRAPPYRGRVGDGGGRGGRTPGLSHAHGGPSGPGGGPCPAAAPAGAGAEPGRGPPRTLRYRC